MFVIQLVQLIAAVAGLIVWSAVIAGAIVGVIKLASN